MPNDPLLCVLSSESPTASDQALCRLAQFLGLRTEIVPLRGKLTEPPQALAGPSMGRVLAFGSRALTHLVRRKWFAGLLNETRFAFAYGFAATGQEAPDLKWLTGGRLSSVTSLDAGEKLFTVHSGVKFGNFPVSGDSYSEKTGCMSAFSAVTVRPGLETYMSANGHPLFVTVQRGGATVFLLAGGDWVDIDMALAPGASLRPWYAQLVAASIFLRTAFGLSCWTSAVTPATFILDDPYLKRRYGFVQYDMLSRKLADTRSAMTVAFIPYNCHRSERQTTDLLRRYADRFSIAIHGCDHTDGEFASLDERWLAGTAACAVTRMEAHARETNMPFDKVMVFPQGLFSTKAISALRICGFDAVVNTSPWPVDYHRAPLTIRDLLDVAVTRYESFPIFVRRYPRDVFDYAFDTLFQKPILAVEHHEFFRPGYQPFVDFVQAISRLSRKVTWMPLGRSVMSSCVLKQNGDGQTALRHFGPMLRFKNPSTRDLALKIEKPEQNGKVQAVLVGNERVPFEVQSGMLKYSTCVRPGEELNASVLYHGETPANRSVTWKYRLAVSARRALSDSRDNYLARSKRLLSLAVAIKNSVAAGKKPNRKSP